MKNEYLLESEGGPLGVSEAGRHISILGSMALAKEGFTEKKHYLAKEATLIRQHNHCQPSNHLHLSATVLNSGKRDGNVKGEISDDQDRLLYTAEVKYQKLQQPIFERFFSQHKTDTAGEFEGATYEDRKPLSNIQFQETSVSAQLQEVEPKDCAGHFNHYPALPVAAIGSHFCDLGIQLFQHITGESNKKAIITKAEIEAEKLVFWGSAVEFEAHLLDPAATQFPLAIQCTAKIGETIYAKLLIEVADEGHLPTNAR